MFNNEQAIGPPKPRDRVITEDGRVFFPCQYCSRAFQDEVRRFLHVNTCTAKKYILSVGNENQRFPFESKDAFPKSLIKDLFATSGCYKSATQVSLLKEEKAEEPTYYKTNHKNAQCLPNGIKYLDLKQENVQVKQKMAVNKTSKGKIKSNISSRNKNDNAEKCTVAFDEKQPIQIRKKIIKTKSSNSKNKTDSEKLKTKDTLNKTKAKNVKKVKPIILKIPSKAKKVKGQTKDDKSNPRQRKDNQNVPMQKKDKISNAAGKPKVPRKRKVKQEPEVNSLPGQLSNPFVYNPKVSSENVNQKIGAADLTNASGMSIPATTKIQKPNTQPKKIKNTKSVKEKKVSVKKPDLKIKKKAVSKSNNNTKVKKVTENSNGNDFKLPTPRDVLREIEAQNLPAIFTLTQEQLLQLINLVPVNSKLLNNNNKSENESKMPVVENRPKNKRIQKEAKPSMKKEIKTTIKKETKGSVKKQTEDSAKKGSKSSVKKEVKGKTKEEAKNEIEKMMKDKIKKEKKKGIDKGGTKKPVLKIKIKTKPKNVKKVKIQKTIVGDKNKRGEFTNGKTVGNKDESRPPLKMVIKNSVIVSSYQEDIPMKNTTKDNSDNKHKQKKRKTYGSENKADIKKVKTDKKNSVAKKVVRPKVSKLKIKLPIRSIKNKENCIKNKVKRNSNLSIAKADNVNKKEKKDNLKKKVGNNDKLILSKDKEIQSSLFNIKDDVFTEDLDEGNHQLQIIYGKKTVNNVEAKDIKVKKLKVKKDSKPEVKKKPNKRKVCVEDKMFSDDSNRDSCQTVTAEEKKLVHKPQEENMKSNGIRKQKLENDSKKRKRIKTDNEDGKTHKKRKTKLDNHTQNIKDSEYHDASDTQKQRGIMEKTAVYVPQDTSITESIPCSNIQKQDLISKTNKNDSKTGKQQASASPSPSKHIQTSIKMYLKQIPKMNLHQRNESSLKNKGNAIELNTKQDNCKQITKPECNEIETHTSLLNGLLEAESNNEHNGELKLSEFTNKLSNAAKPVTVLNGTVAKPLLSGEANGSLSNVDLQDNTDRHHIFNQPDDTFEEYEEDEYDEEMDELVLKEDDDENESKVEPLWAETKQEEKGKLTETPHKIDLVEDVTKRTCKLCFMVFPNPMDLLRHKRSAHTFPKILMSADQLQQYYFTEDKSQCPVCGRPIKDSNKYYFGRHLKTHLDMMNYTCSRCEKKFRRIDHMKDHEKRHID